jgi:hypothetical protein
MTPRAFNAATVRSFVPAQSGVYGLSNARNWLMIGESDNIQQSLLEHLNDVGAEQSRPTGFIFEVCDRAARSLRHRRLVGEYHPARS